MRARPLLPAVYSNQVFVLAVWMTFKNVDDRDKWVAHFKAMVDHVKENEPETVSYELAVADNDPCKVLVYERCGRARCVCELWGSVGCLRGQRWGLVVCAARAELDDTCAFWHTMVAPACADGP